MSASIGPILVYGATGYMGGLVVDHAVAEGHDVIVGGRSAGPLAEMATASALPSRAGGVSDIDLGGVGVVINAAGPFARTAPGLARRCVDSGVHYLDLAGEVAEYRTVQALDAKAIEAGVMLMPGVGFGVVPTDCLALHLSERLRGAIRLDIAFATNGGVSGGTLTSMASMFGDRCEVPGPDLMITEVEFADDTRRCVQNPWRGDLLTAPISTGIGNVTTWIAVPRPLEMIIASAHRRGDVGAPPLGTRFLRAVAKRLPAGPSAKQLDKGDAQVWAQLTDADGTTVSATLTTPDAYRHTAHAAVASAAAVLAGSVTPGFRTPGEQFGADFVLDLPGVVRTDR